MEMTVKETKGDRENLQKPFRLSIIEGKREGRELGRRRCRLQLDESHVSQE